MKNNTRNLLSKIIPALAFSLAFVPMFAFASADVTLSASKVQVKAGDEFTVAISVSPLVNQSAYTSKIALSFNADTVSIAGFTLAPTWLGLSQPGYDLTDNTVGSLIKTAGYPGGLSSKTVFGTVTFKALKNGTATISVTNATAIYDNTNQNVFSGTVNSVQVTVATPAQTVTPASAVAPALTGSTGGASTVGTATTSLDTTTATSTTDQNNQVAAAAASGTSSHTLWYIIIALVLAGIASWLWFSRKA